MSYFKHSKIVRMRRFLFLIFLPNLVFCNRVLPKRALQKSHEKSQLEKWEDQFLWKTEQFDQTASLVNLLSKIAINYLSGCTTIILYDNFTQNSNDLLLEKLFRTFPIPYVHGQITEQYSVKIEKLMKNEDTCVHYLLFLKDIMRCRDVIGPQSSSKVVAVARSSQWRVYEFLGNDESHSFMNLLVIALSEKIVSTITELPYILYTHKLYVDALGASVHQVLTSWRNNSFTRPHINLFPRKIIDGFAGHRFIISVADQPPFVIKKERDEDDNLQWDGIEIQLLDLLAKVYNFSTDFREAKDYEIVGSADAVTETVQSDKANLGIAGLYVTEKVLKVVDTSNLHSQDCAAFISLTSTALPRYRAIMGPFHWTVWLSITFIYLFAIFPLAFSDKHTLRHLLKSPEEIENMFWYVFGTFTNCFSFVGQKSWSKSEKFATRLLIGFYWMFSIIITACYTSSIIAFVTVPVYPVTVDTPQQLLQGRYQIGTLNKGGWSYWFENSSDPVTAKLFKKIDLVDDVQSGIKNTTKAFFWPYAFMGSQSQLDYIVRTNFTTIVGLIYNKNSLHGQIINVGVLRAVQSGLIDKIKSDVEWRVLRSATGKLLSANSYGSSLQVLSVEDRALTLDDTQGMFLLLGIGFLIGAGSLLSEWLGGCVNFCKGKKRPSTTSSLESNYRSHDVPTPRQKLDSLQNNCLEPTKIIEEERNCIVHNSDQKEHQNDSSDISEQIDKIFNFEEVFGDANSDTKHELKEELIDS